MTRLVFLDLVCPKPYDSETSKEEAQGGTESTVARVAEGLASTGNYEVIVAQHCRTEEGKRGKAIYCGVEDLAKLTRAPAATICLRTPKGLPWLKAEWPNAKLFLWCHDENYSDLVSHHDLIAQTGTKILGVSRYHKLRIQDAFLSTLGKFPKVTVDFIYNPVEDALYFDEQYPKERPTTDPNSFLFFSSPHKGLANTLEQFKHIRRRWKGSRLYVANPGYYQHDEINMAGVSPLGELSHPMLVEKLTTAFCVLHLNAVFPETFGIVHAEANALGVPVITSGLGANREVLHSPAEQTLDVRSTEMIIKRLEKWKEFGRPKVAGKPEFKLSNVIRAWEGVLR